MSNFAEGLVQGFAGTADGLYKTLRTAEAIKTAKQNRDIRETTKAAQTAWDDEKARINADTNLSDHDRRQALNAARGDYYDKLGAKYEEYGRGTDYNNIINAAGNARKEGRAHMLDMDQRAAYQAHEQAYQVKQRQGMASMVEKARNGDANALAYMQDIADYAGVQFKSENGQFLWAPKGADNAQFVPMDMNRALEAYNAFTSFEDKIRQRLQSEALLKGDAGKYDEHNAALDNRDKTREAIASSKAARERLDRNSVEYKNGIRFTKDPTGKVIEAINPVTGERAFENDTDGTQTVIAHGKALKTVDTLLRDKVKRSERDLDFKDYKVVTGEDGVSQDVVFQKAERDDKGNIVKGADGKPKFNTVRVPYKKFIYGLQQRQSNTGTVNTGAIATTPGKKVGEDYESK